MHTFFDNFEARQSNTPATYAAAAVNGEWISLQDCEYVVFIATNGELDGNMPVIVLEATDENGSNADTIASLTGTFTNGTDEGRIGGIEVHESDLSEGFTHVSLRVTPAATDSFAAIAIRGGLHSKPASNLPTDGVAFVDKTV